jgi:hypothetical protein
MDDDTLLGSGTIDILAKAVGRHMVTILEGIGLTPDQCFKVTVAATATCLGVLLRDLTTTCDAEIIDLVNEMLRNKGTPWRIAPAS